jgi:hypothetical protein
MGVNFLQLDCNTFYVICECDLTDRFCFDYMKQCITCDMAVLVDECNDTRGSLPANSTDVK